MSALPKTPLGTAPEAPDLPPVDELARGLGRLVKRTQARKLRHTPIDKPIRQAAALAYQRKQGQREAQQAHAVKANAQAQRAANTAKLVDTVVSARKPKNAPQTPQQAQTPTPPPQGQPAASQTQQPRYGFRTPPPTPGKQPMQPAAAKPTGQPTGPLIPQAPAPAPIKKSRAPGGLGPVVGKKRPIVLQGRPRQRKPVAPGMLGKGAGAPSEPIPVETERPTLGQLQKEAGITPGEGMKPAAPIKPRGIRPRKPRDTSDTQATQTQALPPQTSLPNTPKPREPDVSDEGTVIAPQPTPPATPPQRGDVTPRQRLAERLMAMLKRGEWEGFMRRAGGNEPRRVAEERARAAREANWHRIETQLDDLRRDKEK